MARTRFRKSINLGGGARLNLSSKGVGASFGVKGLRVTKRADGRTTVTTSLPGTGFSRVNTIHSPGKAGSTPLLQPHAPDGLRYWTGFGLNILPGLGFLVIGRVWLAFNWFVGTILLVVLTGKGWILIPIWFGVLLHYRAVWIRDIAPFITERQIDSPAIPPMGSARRMTFRSAEEFKEAARKIRGDVGPKARFSFDHSPETFSAQLAHLKTFIYALASAQTVWLVIAEEASASLKMAAGRSIHRARISMNATSQPIDVNAAFPVYEVTTPGWFNRLLWLPDGLVTITTVNALEHRYTFEQATLKLDTVRFLEADIPPIDAVQAGETWLYLNKNGSPDLRYSNNKKVPIMEYAEITITLRSASELSNFVFQVSNKDAALAAYSALQQLMKPGSSTQNDKVASVDVASALKVLGLTPTASSDEITIAYRDLVKSYHPDRVGHLAPEFIEVAERRMKEINQAYEVLKSRDQ